MTKAFGLLIFSAIALVAGSAFLYFIFLILKVVIGGIIDVDPM